MERGGAGEIAQVKLMPRAWACLYQVYHYTSECKNRTTLLRRLVTFSKWVDDHNGTVVAILLAGDDSEGWNVTVFAKDILDMTIDPPDSWEQREKQR
jgi:hypothetical protein